MGDRLDHQTLAAEVLGIRNAPPELARRLVAQALVLEDRRDEWIRIGERICAEAPAAAGVYLLRDAADRVLYVGKANNIRRRMRTHFAVRRWRGLKAEFARAVSAEWLEVGSELEALLREAQWIEELRPTVNVQVGAPALASREIPPALVRDVVVLLPSSEADSVELVGARASGATFIQRTRRDGSDLFVHTQRLWRFFFGVETHRGPGPGVHRGLAPIVFSWLSDRGAAATRLDPADAASVRQFRELLRAALEAEQLFAERIVVLNSMFRLTGRPRAQRARPASIPPRP
jgi:predicted GIY-YIG superfamily endonuclease